VAIDVESWQLFSRTVGEHHEFRTTMPRLEEAEASAQQFELGVCLGNGTADLAGPAGKAIAAGSDESKSNKQ
jgi:hypothetical protein